MDNYKIISSTTSSRSVQVLDPDGKPLKRVRRVEISPIVPDELVTAKIEVLADLDLAADGTVAQTRLSQEPEDEPITLTKNDGRIFYTSDLHLDHSNMIDYEDRPYVNVNLMNEDLIARFNNVVKNSDDVYILGDLTLRSKRSVVEAFVKRLHGRKHLIIGNHDYYAKSTWAKELFASVDYYKEIHDRGRKVVLCHYPIARWNGMEKGSYHLYGHVHSRPGEWQEWRNAFNVGVDANDYEPQTLDQLITREEQKNDKM